MGILWSLSKSTTELIFNLSEYALLAGGVILVVALIGEIRTEDRNRVWYRRFAWAVAVGVGIELMADFGVFFSSHKLQAFADVELASADARIAALSPRILAIANNRTARSRADIESIWRAASCNNGEQETDVA